MIAIQPQTVKCLAAGLLIGALLGVVSAGQAQMRNDMPRLKAQEFEGINQVLNVLGNTNVHRMDKNAVESFQESLDAKNATVFRQAGRSTAPIKNFRAVPGAPPRVQQRAF